MKLVKSILILLLFVKLANASETIKIADDVLDYRVDRIGNVYFFDSKNVLTKYETKIKRYTRYADLRSGKITSIDVNNPLRVIVFYADQGIVKFLDVNLTEINSLQIRKTYSEGWISLVSSSNNNGIWMYDNVNRKIIKLAEQLNLVFQSSDLYLVLAKKINPTFLVEYGDELFLGDQKLGIFVFDLYGGYKKTLPVFANTITQIENNKILFEQNKSLLKYESLKLDTLILNTGNHSNIRFFLNDYVYYLDGQSLFQQMGLD